MGSVVAQRDRRGACRRTGRRVDCDVVANRTVREDVDLARAHILCHDTEEITVQRGDGSVDADPFEEALFGCTSALEFQSSFGDHGPQRLGNLRR